tara:strand:+ start:861 stop:2702 length:1842 start_codon:yes stop_codon:yes gene_type:complete
MTREEKLKRLQLLQAQERAKKLAELDAAQRSAFAQQNMLPSPDNEKLPNRVEPNRFGDTAAEFSAPAREAMRAYAARMMAEDRNLLQRAGDAGMTGLAALGAAYGGTAGLLGDIVGGDRTQERKAARDFMLLGEVAIPELASVPSAVSRIARQGAELPAKQAAAQAAQDINVTPTLGMQGRGAGLIEAAAANVPFSAGNVVRANERVVDQMSDAFQTAVGKVGTPTSVSGAGEAAQRGGQAFVNTFQDKSTRLYDAVDKKIGFNTKVQAPNALATVKELTKYAQEYPEISNFLNRPKFQSLLSSLEKETKFLNEAGRPFQILNEVPYELLADLRSSVGKSVSKIKGPLADLSEADLKRLYGALSDDMRLAAEKAGPDAVKAFNRANKYYSAGQARIDSALKKITKADVTPEKAYSEIVALATADSPRGSTKKLLELKKSLPKDEWSTVSATIFRKLGEARPAQAGAPDASDFAEFNPATFLTNYNKMDKSAKLVLLSGNVPRSAASELDKLARVVERYKRRPVSTGSSPANAVLAFFAGTAADFGAAAMIAASTFAGTKLLTSTPALKAVNAAAAGNFTKLRRLAQDGSAIGSEAATLLRLIGADQAREEEPN